MNLPFHLRAEPVLSRTAVTRHEELRADRAALHAGWPTARVLAVDPNGCIRMDGYEAMLEPALDYGSEPPQAAVLLGVIDDRHVWAVEVPALGAEGRDLRAINPATSEQTIDLLVTAVAVLNWHQASAYSGVDGSPAMVANAGWSRVSATGNQDFPRTDPAVICLVHDGDDHVLLARGPRWPERRMSVLAGFVEAGESLEACVEREILEEVGIRVRDIRYLGSQPWPFPRSLMVGFSAVGDRATPLRLQEGEILDAGWFSRDEVREALDHGDWTAQDPAPLLLPGTISIARSMIESWAYPD
ncbi:NAD(+) diphosphatase [Millisia brevis]|uniref:NAD(+) diphosphatase n=1 Tax=Millisia brevis TaxID=264148 RepID=UPI00082C2F8D|nr:NAD(+) diphosphatase [Millisia brevis]